MEAPGCWHAATNWALNSAVYVLWVYCAECLGISNSLGMVCTIVCVHTILRDARPRFKTGLPDAYGRKAMQQLLPQLRAAIAAKTR